MSLPPTDFFEALTNPPPTHTHSPLRTQADVEFAETLNKETERFTKDLKDIERAASRITECEWGGLMLCV